MHLNTPFVLTPEYREYVWGGERLRPGRRTAEMWAIHEDNRVASGPLAGRTLAELAQAQPADLLGARAARSTGARFPLLIKILDCAEWLSLQVHPDDARAEALEGPGFFGKTEAWHVLDAAPGAQLIAGLQPGVDAEILADAIRSGALRDRVSYLPARRGDTLFIAPGTIHALGPGLLIYEVQQSSDLTYRVFDWDRPPVPGRVLHIEKSLTVADVAAGATILPEPARVAESRAVLTACRYFTLELLQLSAAPLALQTGGQTFHALTVIEGEVELRPAAGAERTAGIVLQQYESAVVPAACHNYELHPRNRARLLKASIEA